MEKVGLLVKIIGFTKENKGSLAKSPICKRDEHEMDKVSFFPPNFSNFENTEMGGTK